MNRASREQQYREIVSRWQAPLQRLCPGYERDVRAQRELLRALLTAIWRHLPHELGDASLEVWVFRIANNAAARQMARIAKKKR